MVWHMKNRTALLSVYDKTGIVAFAQGLLAVPGQSWEILASGGTAKVLIEAGIPVTDTGSIVGGPILGHRVVTLSREIHAGLLAKDNAEDRAELESLKIKFIDLVCCDLYPLKAEIAKTGSTKESVIEQTDIGGPTMLRSGAKAGRITVCDPADRTRVVEWLTAGEPDRDAFIEMLRAKAEYTIADYVLTSAKYHGTGTYEGFNGTMIAECKYGENAYQTPARVYSANSADLLSIDKFALVAGSSPSYNNWCDLDRMLQTITHIAAGFDVNFSKVPKIALAVKHGNTCGAAVGDDATEVLKKMIMGDPRAIFGGLVIANFPIDEMLAEVLLSYNMPEGARRILDGIIAPSFAESAIEVLKRKGDKCRFMANSALEHMTKGSLDTSARYRYARGGFLMQPNYTFVLALLSTDLAKNGIATSQQEQDMLLAKAICDTSNSNTIALVKDGQLIGNGVGQQDRVGAANLALMRAKGSGHEAMGAVAASDSFFPFPDAPELLVTNGIKAILSTSGSINDSKAVEVCQKNGVPLYLVPDTMGRGFFGH
jgi:phosphoribosylaminoimidazolecarboxamide formyltransferase/IMP cyclohydrolase